MNRLKELRERYGISQSRLAEIIEVHQSYVSLWENDKVKLNDLKFHGIERMLILDNCPEITRDSVRPVTSQLICWDGTKWIDVTGLNPHEMKELFGEQEDGQES